MKAIACLILLFFTHLQAQNTVLVYTTFPPFNGALWPELNPILKSLDVPLKNFMIIEQKSIELYTHLRET